jgi:hypothetical protein
MYRQGEATRASGSAAFRNFQQSELMSALGNNRTHALRRGWVDTGQTAPRQGRVDFGWSAFRRQIMKPDI